MSAFTRPRLNPFAAVLVVIVSIGLSLTAQAQDTGADATASPSPTLGLEQAVTLEASPAPSVDGEDVVTASPSPPLVVTVEAGDLWFSPREVSIEAGEGTMLALTGVGQVGHNLIIDELGLQLHVGPGTTSEVDVSEVPPGSYQFYCSVYGHARAGMVGTLTIEHPAEPASPEPVA